MNGLRGQFAVFYSHHGGCGTLGANAIATTVNARNAGLELLIHLNESFLGNQTKLYGKGRFLLPNGLHYLVGRQNEISARDRFW